MIFINLNKILLGTAVLGGTFAVAQNVNADQVTVQTGDTLSQLAVKHGTTVEKLKQNNNLSSDLIITGQKLETGDAQTSQSQDGTYTVVAGDTLGKIAEKFNTTVANLKALNGLGSDLIIVGQTLQVSGQAQVATSTQTQQAQSYQAPVQQQTYAQPQTSYQAPAQQTQSYQAPAQQQASTYTSNATGSEAEAKAWIAQRESGGNYNARNGQFVGKFQLTSSYLNGDYSPANQERTADNYVKNRYGSWQNAKSFWMQHNYY